MKPAELTELLKSECHRLGFQLAGACPAVQPAGFNHFEHWLDSGYNGEMDYLPARKEAYRHPENVLSGAISVLMLGMNYQTAEPAQPSIGRGQVSRYAWGDIDYHDVIHAKLEELVRFCEGQSPEIKARGVVDTAPLLEREFGQLAGIGWQAKNTMLINRRVGSWFFLAALLLNVPLDYDDPHHTSHCGTCTACIDACPTSAFLEPHVLDANRCISYLTIEHRSPIPLELRPGIGSWIFGCDVCQDVCPWNNKAERAIGDVFTPVPDRNPMGLIELFFLNDDQFRAMFRKTPLWRPKRRGIVRNAAIALGNCPSDAHIGALTKGLNDDEELIRGASAWALGNHAIALAEPVLRDRLSIESSHTVIDEIILALKQLSNSNHD